MITDFATLPRDKLSRLFKIQKAAGIFNEHLVLTHTGVFQTLQTEFPPACKQSNVHTRLHTTPRFGHHTTQWQTHNFKRKRKFAKYCLMEIKVHESNQSTN